MVETVWKKLPLGEVITLQRGFDLPHKARKPGTVPIISSSGYSGTHNESRALAPGVVTGRYGTIGEVFYITEDYWPLNTTLYVKDFKGNFPAFIALFLKTIDFQSYSGKSGVPGVNRNDLHEIQVHLPTIPEQHAITTALSDVDSLISALDKFIAKKRNIKQAAMQQLLTGKKRLPGFGGEWEVKRLGDCLSSRPDYGINAPAVPYSDKLPVYIRITDITDDGRFSPEKRVSVDSGETDNYYLSDGDIVFARTGASVGKSYRYDVNDGQLVFAGFLIRVRPDPRKLLTGFAAAYVTTGYYWNWVRLMSMRSGQPGINGNEYAQLPIPIPPLPEQRAIATLLSDMDAELAALEAKRDKIRALKQGMMQELLTGRIRLV